MTTTQPPPTTTSTTTSSSSSKPPVNLQPTTHLDPGAYVRGSHPITFGNNTLIHPRAQISSTYGPLHIGDNCIISEKCIIGGPLPASSSSSSTTASSTDTSSTNSHPSDPSPTTIRSQVHIHAHASIQHGALVESSSIVEAHATILSGVKVGAHSKICAGVTVDRDVPEWTVVYGNGDQRRRRIEDDIAEKGRVLAMDREREATVTILRNVARLASLARRK